MIFVIITTRAEQKRAYVCTMYTYIYNYAFMSNIDNQCFYIHCTLNVNYDYIDKCIILIDNLRS